jgi:diaminopimelate epimerase
MFKIDQVRFSQYSATGNTFVLLDNREYDLPQAAQTARELCGRLGVDGMLLVEASEKADLRMRIINRDGSEASMCGNGSRAAAHWAHQQMKLPADFLIETLAGVLEAHVDGDVARVRLTDPQDFKLLDGFDAAGAMKDVYFVNTGVPHCVTEFKDLNAVNIHQLGNEIRHHERFGAAGTNASFFAVIEPGKIRVRVYERGVEAETQSCGTGSAACALVAAKKYGFASPVTVKVESGDELKIYFDIQKTGFKNVNLEGAVRCLKKGVIAL